MYFKGNNRTKFFWQQHDSCASKGSLTNACTDFTNALFTLLIDERALLLGGVFCPVCYLWREWNAVLCSTCVISGTYNGIHVPVTEIPEPVIRIIV